MKAIVIEQYGGIEELKELELERPVINDDQVLLEIHATSINPIDWKLREGYLKEMLPFEFPIILGWDAAGVIAERGKNVTKFEVGDRVFTRPLTTRQGTYAEYVPVEEYLLAKMPETMSFEEGAAIPLTGLTAWEGLVEIAGVKEGDKVLVHAGAGGVGTFAIQIAKSFGAFVATTASEKNAELLESLGADQVIDYKNEDFSEVLSDFDIVLDTMGGEIRTKSFGILKSKGKLVSIIEPPSEGEEKKYDVEIGYLFLEPDGAKLQKLADLYESGKLKAVIGETFDFTEKGLKNAHKLSETHHAQGKLVVRIK
ncbi:NADPH:quinone reductase-like Zn-dependent oxidoreductase [Planomicrobium soli]|uniref:NADPH:quinone reductase-like Zn-dependent oxidoreductase n=1 Tax=Planomicrobium soli TaxID=1176648 RepID=A0A2P8GAY3_9BACL|nr:NADP-dependent oxidoreductase [Planomicrobium soli]PSL31055.1 NADPH:quinone reductase-like Zn-dependent oxidoreductase [Planomicrobium soli]